jgi:hypothetical protein
VRPGLHTRCSRGRAHSTRVITSTSRPMRAHAPSPNPAPTPAWFDHSRKLFSQTPEAPGPRYQAGRFSFNVKGGRCEACAGRRHDQDRDALPARRLRAVRGVQGRPLQPRHARHHRSRARTSPRCSISRARRRRVLRQPARHRATHADTGRRRASATCGSASLPRRCRAARPSG